MEEGLTNVSLNTKMISPSADNIDFKVDITAGVERSPYITDTHNKNLIKSENYSYDVEDDATSCSSYDGSGRKYYSSIYRDTDIFNNSFEDIRSPTPCDFLAGGNTASCNYDYNLSRNTGHEIFDITELKSVPKFINYRIESGFESASFMVTNLGTIINQFHLWKKELPMVQPFYAVKCNPDAAILRVSYFSLCSFG